MKIDKKLYIFISLLLFCEIFFFRNVLFNDSLFGDFGDARLTMLITEHWYRFLQGLEKINDLGIFYPAENTLAYSDMFLGYGIIHLFFRFCGLDMFISYKITLILVHILGVFSLFYFLTKVLKVDYFWSFFGTSAFSFSCTSANQFFHPQLNVANFIPLFLIFFVKSVQNVDNRLKKNIYMYSAIFVVILILYTAWYVFFFSTLFIFVLLLVSFILFSVNKINIKDTIKKFGYDIIGYIVFAILLMIPFLMAELPVLKMSGDRNYTHILQLLGNFFSYIYTRNSIFDFVLKPLSKDCHMIFIQMGFSFVLLIAFFTFFIFIFLKKKEKEFSIIFYKSIFISLIICLLLPVKIPFTDSSLWFLVYKFFIGGTSIRMPTRFLFVLSLPISVICAICGNIFFNIKDIGDKKYITILSIICVLLFVSNINTVGVNSQYTREQEIVFLNSIPSPPKDCKVFYLINPYVNQLGKNRKILNSIIYRVAGHEIAYKYNLKIINGYSGLVPKDYGIIEELSYSMENFYSKNYKNSITEWIKRYNLENVYTYDIKNQKWKKVKK